MRSRHHWEEVMTREVAKSALDVLSDVELRDVVSAFSFMKGCATYAGVPYAESWQLGYLKDGICPWRIIDRDARRGPSADNVAFTFSAASTAGLRLEMQAYAKAFRGLKEYQERGVSIDLMASSRRWPRPASPERPRASADQRQHRYGPGMRVRLLRFALDPYANDNELVPSGTCGGLC
jgi:hypothetical protein